MSTAMHLLHQLGAVSTVESNAVFQTDAGKGNTFTSFMFGKGSAFRHHQNGAGDPISNAIGDEDLAVRAKKLRDPIHDATDTRDSDSDTMSA